MVGAQSGGSGIMTGRRHFSMIRGFHLADWFTLANGFCGTAAIFAVMEFLQSGRVMLLWVAVALIPAALVFDVLDGRIARWRQQDSVMGRELDSLADVISFGVAPAAIAYGFGMQGGWDIAILLFFVGCGVSRLARYNVSAETMAAATGKVTHFEGTPIPTSTLLVLILGVAVWQGAIGDALWFGALRIGPATLHPLVLMYAVSGALMISRTVRIPKP
jgi:CDP-diacylglycerol--serine O-phosphatidyltransferase